MNGYVFFCLVNDINDNCVSLGDIYCRSWKLAIYGQYALVAAKPAVRSIRYLQQINHIFVNQISDIDIKKLSIVTKKT